mgnify:CR=1 FL=1
MSWGGGDSGSVEEVDCGGWLITAIVTLVLMLRDLLVLQSGWKLGILAVVKVIGPSSSSRIISVWESSRRIGYPERRLRAEG